MAALYLETLQKLEKNSAELYEEVTRLLIKVADNVLKEPSNPKFRMLQKNNATISNKILKVQGGLDCLKMMGFEENSTSLTLPISAPLNKLQAVKEEIIKRKKVVAEGGVPKKDESTGAIPKTKQTETSNSHNKSQTKETVTSHTSKVTNEKQKKITQDIPQSSELGSMTAEKPIKQIVLPPLKLLFQNSFLQEIERYFHQALVYGNKELQVRAKNLIPICTLEDKAKIRLRTYQESAKKEKLQGPEIGLQDMLLLELLAWFKEEFFTWVDSPQCANCGGNTRYKAMSTDPQLMLYTNRVEMHSCDVCGSDTPFPRYNDLNILLETRKGRCGEWANTFTLMARSMGWDARIVFDQTDHVWTEVYSEAQKRWLHCDSCENVCDTPLIYENGWGKTVTYIISYNDEEVQDATWRYSSNHKEVIKRRTKCQEEELASALLQLRTLRQSTLSHARQIYLRKRCLMELVEMMVERKPNSTDLQGRTSGSVTWRLNRGETKAAGYTWPLSHKGKKDSITFSYSTATDRYEIIYGDGKKTLLNGWEAGVFESTNLFRKEEKDWKQVYLARIEGVEEATIVWQFNVTDANKCIDSVDLTFEYQLYENGLIRTKICDDNTCVMVPKGKMQLKTQDFQGSKGVKIVATLSGGTGEVKWQQSQLFRQPSTSSNSPFHVTFTLKDVNVDK